MSDYEAEKRKLRFFNFIKIIPETECWEWQGIRYPTGYGQFWWGKDGKSESKTIKASRAAWRIYREDIISDEHFVLHKCHNRPCCNPDHLYLGNHARNMLDRNEAGRTAKGDKQPCWKHTPEMIQNIMANISSGKQIADVCKSVGIGWTTFYRFRDAHPELRALIKATKSARYSNADRTPRNRR